MRCVGVVHRLPDACLASFEVPLLLRTPGGVWLQAPSGRPVAEGSPSLGQGQQPCQQSLGGGARCTPVPPETYHRVGLYNNVGYRVPPYEANPKDIEYISKKLTTGSNDVTCKTAVAYTLAPDQMP
eukprot:1247688-Rhodomonas_salina.1